MEEFLNIIKAIIYGIVEGITEWLPISSTGHLILVEDLIKFNLSPEFMAAFRVVIQLGAIMAVVILYFNKLNPFSPRKTAVQKSQTWQMWFKVLVACVPAAVIGILFDDLLDKYLYNSWVVSAMLIIYGVLFIALENRRIKPRIMSLNQLSYKYAFYIGMLQLLALIPGTSRSGVTILGAVFLGASRSVSAEFSFFLSIPVMFGASLLKLVKSGLHFTGAEWSALAVGTVVAFVVSVFAIKFLMSYIKKHDFKAFGYYRIVLGIILLIYFGIRAMV
ncbi:MAG: undecaprenyl-diphosphate phosphatase [Oscillospiraceae bacterium]